MKNKILILFSFVIAAFVISCEKDIVNPTTTEDIFATGGGAPGEADVYGDDAAFDRRFPCLRGTEIRPSNLPAAIRRYIAANYSDLRVVSVIANRDRGYAVAFGNGLVVLFNLDGEFVKVCKRPRPTRDSTHTVRDTFRHVRDTTIVRPPRDTMRGPGRDTIRGPHGPRGPRGPRNGG